MIFIGATFREKLVSHHQAVIEADSCVHTRRAGSKAVARTKESHLIGRLVGVKVPKTADSTVQTAVGALSLIAYFRLATLEDFKILYH